MHMSDPLPQGLSLSGQVTPEFAKILSADALALIAALHRKFEARRQELLARRAERQRQFDAGALPDFLPETKKIRDAEWKIAQQPADLLDRRVEITGPTDRKMVNNALNERTAVLIPRPRGWHLDEKHLTVDGKPVAGGLFDFALYFFHNAKELLARDAGPYFYLPKMESHLEARLWNDIFRLAQKELGVPQGSIKATALIETVVAAFEMDEILWELREHSAGLNIGRWDYIFSCIKKFRANRGFCLADRAQVTMTAPFMRTYALLLVKTCHRRGAPAMGGMAAQIPIKNDPAANEAALAKVREDKLREVTDGCDGTWVAHPGLVPIAKEVFDEHMPRPNQYDRQRPDVIVAARDLLEFRPEGPITEAGLRNNISVGIQYLGAWLAGNGCVPVFNLMEDAATAEISRSQIWQWMRSPKGKLQDGRKVTEELFRTLLTEELPKVKTYLGDEAWKAGKYEEGAKLFDRITTDDRYVEFLTLPAYNYVD